MSNAASHSRESDFEVLERLLRKACYGPGSLGLSIREHSQAKAALLRLKGDDVGL